MPNRKIDPLTRGFFDGRIPRVIAHRGSSGTHPENTLAAFEQAIIDGADVLEMDVHRTADNQVIVIHDHTLERTTNGVGLVAEKTLAQIKALDAGYHFSDDQGLSFPFRGQGIRVPTLEEVLAAFPNVPMNIEIKANDQVLIDEFLRLLEKHDRFTDITVLVLIAAEKNELAMKVRSAEPRAVTGHSYWEVLRFLVLTWLGMPFFFKPSGPAIQVPEKEKWIPIVTRHFIASAHRAGMEVHVFTIDEEADMQRLLSMGVDALFTNYPARMRRLVDSGNWMKPPAHRR